MGYIIKTEQMKRDLLIKSLTRTVLFEKYSPEVVLESIFLDNLKRSSVRHYFEADEMKKFSLYFDDKTHQVLFEFDYFKGAPSNMFMHRCITIEKILEADNNPKKFKTILKHCVEKHMNLKEEWKSFCITTLKKDVRGIR